MRNVKDFSEFITESTINEAGYYTLADMIDDSPESYEDEKDVWDTIQKIMKIKNPKDIGFISSEDEGTPEYVIFTAIDAKYTGKDIKEIDTGGWGHYYYDKKLNVVKNEDQDRNAYFFNVKDSKKLLK